MDEINFLRDMVKDLQKHTQIIKKRISELDGENKEKGDGETREKVLENEKNSTFVEKFTMGLNQVGNNIIRYFK